MIGFEQASAGGQISVSPDCNPEVIARACALGMVPIPGVFTAAAARPRTVKAWKAVLPRDVSVYAVGGVTPTNMQHWADAGCAGFGVGSNIYKPGMSQQDVEKAARGFVAAWKELRGT